MKLEDQVISLDLAKKLKDLGVKQESLFWWANYSGDGGLAEYGWGIVQHGEYHYETDYAVKGEQYSAFTVAELGEMLPPYKEVYKQVSTYWRQDNAIGIDISMPNSYYENEDNPAFTQYDTTEANARAKMLVYLIENPLFVQGEAK